MDEGVPRHVKELINTTDTYLRTVYDLSEDRVPARQTRLIERLHQAGATVSQTVARMKRAGLISIEGHCIELTEFGRARAVVVTRKHRLAERLLVDIVNMPAILVHDEACRWQHVMSEEVERRIVDLLDGPVTSPWGNPIPGLEAFGVSVESTPVATKLSDISTVGLPVAGVVRCISEHAQADSELMTILLGAGVIPGAQVTVTSFAQSYVVRGLGVIELPKKLAHVLDFDCTDPLGN